MIQRRLLLSLLACACLLPSVSLAQSFPTRPIRVIIPNEPGTLDFYVRMMGPKLQELTGQPWVVEYRAGASGQIGANIVAKSPPDGYTIMFTNPGTHVTLPLLSKNVMYDPVADFTPITVLASSWYCLLVHPTLPVGTVPELIEYAKRAPGKLSYSTNGIGSASHLSARQLELLTGINMVHVPYKGGAPALNAAVAGEVPVTITSIAAGAQQNFKAGKVKMLAVLGPKRFPGLPNVPNMPEVVPGYEPVPNWIAFFGPAGLPKSIADLLRGAVADAVAQDKELRSKIEGTGVNIMTNTPEEFLSMLKRDIANVAKIVKAAGIQPE